MRRTRLRHQRNGRRGEAAVVRYLELHGCRILARNWRCKAGELDIVALDGLYLVFVEVKALHSRYQIRPEINFSRHQMQRDLNAASYYWRCIRAPQLPVRFDFAEVELTRFRVRSLRYHFNYLPLAERLHR